jgi:hypothetical protein
MKLPGPFVLVGVDLQQGKAGVQAARMPADTVSKLKKARRLVLPMF